MKEHRRYMGFSTEKSNSATINSLHVGYHMISLVEEPYEYTPFLFSLVMDNMKKQKNNYNRVKQELKLRPLCFN